MRSFPVVESTTSVSAALSAMNRDGDRTVFIVEKNRLIGVLTEGDVAKRSREVLLSRQNVKAVMNPNPICVTSSHSDIEIMLLFSRTGATVFPITDDDGKLVGVRRVRDSVQRTHAP